MIKLKRKSVQISLDFSSIIMTIGSTDLIGPSMISVSGGALSELIMMLRDSIIKLMSNVEKTSVNFYELVNILGVMALNAMGDARSHAMGLLNRKPRKNILSFEKQLSEASNQLVKKEINSFQFLNKLTAVKHNNQLVDETWGLQHSRIDLQPEVELPEEDVDSPESEFVDTDFGASD